MSPNIDLEGLTKPASLLIEKISSAVGIFFEPSRLRREAQAKAEAHLITTRGEIEAEILREAALQAHPALVQRAMGRLVFEEVRNQQNMESVARQAIALLEPTATPEQIEDDWLASFFGHAKKFSDSDIQKLWAAVLAGECNSPSKYAKKTLEVLASLELSDAETFRRLCSFAWKWGRAEGQMISHPLVYDWDKEIYIERGITYTSLVHLDEMGLINFTGTSRNQANFPQPLHLAYHDRKFLVRARSQPPKLPVGLVYLSRAGSELVSISPSLPCGKGFVEYVLSVLSPFVEITEE